MRAFTYGVTVTAIIALSAGSLPPAFAQDAPTASPEELRSLLEQQQSQSESLDTQIIDDATGLPVAEPLLPEDLDTLVAPVALYPDSLLAQVLVASTFPLQIVKADRLIDESEGLSDEDLTAKLAEQDWDPSVLVLVSGFPTVVQRMADDLDWTEQLGNAMVNQDADVLEAVQRMREAAQETGYLASNEAQTVEDRDGDIYIAPADPEVIYVPDYDPHAAFTEAPTQAPVIVTPQQAQSTGPSPLVAGAVAFGAALLVSQLVRNNGDDDNDDDDWNDYWRDDDRIDWRDRQVYPRVYRQNESWRGERDRYWNRADRRWSYDDALRRERAEDRQRYLAALDRQENQAQMRAMRERMRRADIEEQRTANERRARREAAQARQESQATAAQRERQRRVAAEKAQAADAQAQRQRQQAAQAQRERAAQAQAQRQKQEAAQAQRQKQEAAQAQRQKQEAAQAQRQKQEAAQAQRQKQEAAQAQRQKQEAAQAQRQKQEAAQAQRQKQEAAQAQAQKQKAAQAQAQKQKQQAAAAQAQKQKAAQAQRAKQQAAAQQAQKQKAAQAQAQKQKAAQQKAAQQKKKRACPEGDQNCRQN